MKQETKIIKEKKILLKSIIRTKMELCGYAKEELAIFLFMSRSTFYNRIKDPDSFTVKEIQLLIKTLKFNQDEKSRLLELLF